MSLYFSLYILQYSPLNLKNELHCAGCERTIFMMRWIVKKILLIFLVFVFSACGKNNVVGGSPLQAVTNPQSTCTDSARNSSIYDISSNAAYLCQQGATNNNISICMAAAMRSNSYEIAKDAFFYCQQTTNVIEATCMGGAIESGDRSRAENARFYCQNVLTIEQAQCMSKILKQNDDFHIRDSREHENRRQSAMTICQNQNNRNSNNRDHHDLRRH